MTTPTTEVATVLLCDDAMFMRSVQRQTLEAAGFKIVGEAGTGRESVTQFNNLLPTLTLMDLVMPDMSGIDAVREITKQHPDARILMCSSVGQGKMVSDAIDAGAIGYMVKPFTKEQLLNAVREALEA